MDVTVVMCTRNRQASLSRALDSISAAAVPLGLAWELLIVDNGSTDSTASVIDSFSARLPIRTVREETPGLSHARNCGVAHARGDYIVWTDDDVLVDEAWLEAYWRAFCEHPDTAFFGGRVIPVLEAPTPAWLSDNIDLLEHLVAARDFGDQSFVIRSSDQLPFGANYAVRTAEQRAHRYDPELGVSPTMRRSGEETQVLRAIFEGGAVGRWIPHAVVSHIIPVRRQTYGYVVQHYRAYGETSAYLAARNGRPLHWASRARWQALRGLGKSLVAIAFGHFFAKPRFRLRHTCYYGYHRGVLDYRRQASADALATPGSHQLERR